MLIAICDTETQGLNASTDACLEVAVILFDLIHVSIVEAYCGLLPAQSNPVEYINGISPAVLQTLPLPGRVGDGGVWSRAHEVAKCAETVVAHNASFDRNFIPRHIMALEPWSRPWVCTKQNIVWPRKAPSNKLIEIALAHKLGLSHAHRALTDCMTIARLIERVSDMGHNVEDMFRLGIAKAGPMPVFKTPIRATKPIAENQPAMSLADGDIEL